MTQKTKYLNKQVIILTSILGQGPKNLDSERNDDSLENALTRARLLIVFKLSLVSSVIPPGGCWVDKQSLVGPIVLGKLVTTLV